MILIAIVIFIVGFLIFQAIEKNNALKQKELEETSNKAYREDQKEEEKEFREKYQKKYPHLVGNMEDSTLITLSSLGVNLKKGSSFLQGACNMYLRACVQQDHNADFMFGDLWDLTEELLEHLEKYHEVSNQEHEMAIFNYWGMLESEADLLRGLTDPKVIREKFQSPSFTNLQEIVSWFPKKKLHPKSEISFVDEKTGLFPRKSKGSDFIEKKLKA